MIGAACRLQNLDRRDAAPLNGYNLLVVEDDESARTVLHAVFSQHGWNIALAGTVAEGLAMLNPAPDFLILDLSLPDGNGSAILRRVREANLKTRVAVTTGESDLARIRAVGLLRPEAIFLKPIDIFGVWREGELARAR
jgi:DNA-binding response OmpR family regulator